MTTMTAPPTSIDDPAFDEVFAEAARQRRLSWKFGDKATPPGARYDEMSHRAKAEFLENICQALVDHWAGRDLDPDYEFQRQVRRPR